jgi:hypothetical protein
MNSDPNPTQPGSPSEEQIENILRSIQPKPSPRLYQRLLHAPWQKKPALAQKWAVGILLLGCILVASFLISAPLRAKAHTWILYFLLDRQDSMQVSLGDLSPQELSLYASPENFPYTIEQASQQASYSVLLPDAMLPGISLVGARYENRTATVVLLFSGAGYNLFLSQRPIDAGQEYFSIGTSAVVEEVWIAGIRGEYVSGGWVKQPGPPGTQPASTQYVQVQWDASLPQHTLRWQSDGYAYQLRSTGSESPQKSELIAMAEALIK